MSIPNRPRIGNFSIFSEVVASQNQINKSKPILLHTCHRSFSLRVEAHSCQHAAAASEATQTLNSPPFHRQKGKSGAQYLNKMQTSCSRPLLCAHGLCGKHTSASAVMSRHILLRPAYTTPGCAPLEWSVLGAKLHHDTLHLCSDARSAQVSHLIKWHSGPCSQWVPRDTPSTVVVNPPWGLRLLNDAENTESDQDTRGIVHAPDVERCCSQLFSLLMSTALQPRLSVHCILLVCGKQGCSYH